MQIDWVAVKELPVGTAGRVQRKRTIEEVRGRCRGLQEVKYVMGKSTVESAEVLEYVLDALVTGWDGICRRSLRTDCRWF